MASWVDDRTKIKFILIIKVYHFKEYLVQFHEIILFNHRCFSLNTTKTKTALGLLDLETSTRI